MILYKVKDRTKIQPSACKYPVFSALVSSTLVEEKISSTLVEESFISQYILLAGFLKNQFGINDRFILSVFILFLDMSVWFCANTMLFS
jgi:hypothetical protein